MKEFPVFWLDEFGPDERTIKNDPTDPAKVLVTEIWKRKPTQLVRMDLASGRDQTVVMQALYEQGVVKGLSFGTTQWREVSAKRARTLRKRGALVVYSGRTANGKSRFVWCSFRVNT